MFVLHFSEGEMAASTAILVVIVSVDLTHSDYHHHHQRYWLNPG
jgi:hypothetical protein